MSDVRLWYEADFGRVLIKSAFDGKADIAFSER
jgi:hypothetical protein